MKDDQMFQEKYADLLGSDVDSGRVPVIKELDEIAKAMTLPSSLRGSAAQLFQQHHARQQHVEAKAKRWFPQIYWRSRRLRAAAAVLLIIVMLTGAASGFYALVERVFTMHPSTQPISLEDMGTPLNLLRTVDGFTVTIRQVYADANQVAIAYTISGPPGRTGINFLLFGSYAGKPMSGPSVTIPTLIDVQGRSFSGAPFSWGAGVNDGVGAYLLRYDTPAGIGNPQELKLRLEAGGMEATEVVDSATPVANPEACHPAADNQARICTIVVRGSFVFDFTVPVQRSRVAKLHQAVEAGGRKVILERVVVSPTGTRVALRGVGPNASVELQAGETRTVLQVEGAVPDPSSAEDLWEYRTSESLMEQHGGWTLVVKPNQSANTAEPGIAGGPWIFRFVVP